LAIASAELALRAS